ncbi:hypothetical protein MLD38_023170 [Melastoma candidum]|uniref:Uncharacterized protein n=1 Tax=Melastoma candidum TaxID=119954 RepID=A0ACB9QPQ2_9MYRT|nr:hypothetical protein MLD38_023170 [Melastoma candidum]
MPNGNLDNHLFPAAEKEAPEKRMLTWPQKKSIILDVAKGLAYLHYGVKPAIYHREYKSDEHSVGRRYESAGADFGLAKAKPEGQVSSYDEGGWYARLLGTRVCTLWAADRKERCLQLRGGRARDNVRRKALDLSSLIAPSVPDYGMGLVIGEGRKRLTRPWILCYSRTVEISLVQTRKV